MAQIEKGLQGIKLHLVDNAETGLEFLRWMGERRPYNAVSVDIETGERPGHDPKDALSPWHGIIRLVQVGDGMQGWSIPWEEWKGLFYQAFQDYRGFIVFHNIAFEGKWFDLQSRWKLPWDRAHDTMLMAQVINPLGAAGLKPLSGELVDSQAAALQDGLNTAKSENGWTWGTIPINFEPYWAYGALDTILTMRIFDQFWDLCGPGQVYSLPYEIELQTRKICNRMELNGARVDVEYSIRKRDQLIQYTEKAKQWVKDTHNGTSITSGPQLSKRFVQLGAEEKDFQLTAGGGLKMDADQLKLFIRDGNADIQQLATVALKQRQADKLASAYFGNFIERNIDGILHPQIKTLAARTGRMSITDPALQTLPSGDATVRHAFIPRTEGYGIVSSDLDQVEFRLTAALSGDAALINVFKEADATQGDVFTTIMREVYQDSSLVKADPRRKLIKSTIYGKLYGAGVDKMALTSGVSTAQMQSVVSAFDDSYPGVKLFQKSVENTGMKRLRSEGQAYVTTATGRRLPADSNRVYSLTNYLIQASGAEIFKQNLIKMDQADLTEYLVVPVHDEIVLEVPQTNQTETNEIIQTVQECMTTAEGWAVPLTAGVDGPYSTWGEKYLDNH